MATVAKTAVWGFAIVVAVNQLGIATTLINTLLIGAVGALALAAGLAFGLGGRDRAAAVLDRVSGQVEAAGPKLSRAANVAAEQGRATTQQGRQEYTGTERRRSFKV